MSTVSTIASDITSASAALLNDQEQTVYTFNVQLAYLNMALRELQEYFELNDIPVVYETSTIINVLPGIDVVGFDTNPGLPFDLVDIQQLWERNHGIDPWIPMTRWDFIPHYLEGQETNQFIWWAWVGQAIRLLKSAADNDLKLDYIRTIFPKVTDPSDSLNVINCQSFLQYRTASLCAEFIGENKTRADSLNTDALLALDRVMGIGTKGQQAIITRRRPFRASYKMRGTIW